MSDESTSKAGEPNAAAESVPATINEGEAPPADFALLAHLDGLMHDLRASVPIALTEWQADAIHRSRVATRRMKAALDLMKFVLRKRPRRKLGGILRKLRRRLAPMRDADVMLEHLGELSGESNQHAWAVRWMSQRVARERDKLRVAAAKRGSAEHVLKKLDRWQDVREDVAEAREAMDSLLGESLHLQLDTFAEQADRLVGATSFRNENGDEEDGSTSGETTPRQDPHMLRIAGKALRYTLEMAVVQGHDLPHSLTKTFKKLQDSLGLWHDYVVLADRAIVMALQEGLSHHDPEAMNEVFELLRDVLTHATQSLAQFKQLWTSEGDAVAKAIRTTFPLTRPVTCGEKVEAGTISESETDPDPSGSGSPEAQEDSPPAEPSDA